ncbi:hypothetical protein Glove_276g94 [Diversispora epigaea]|uniref:Uncharacterized protein n=1 Tax=Diversispora epigaea TaxID=1348612 RepID=A0A397I4T4_9GLOM|nr:hypothetical protein Glove_276g94 [Diversispora epigaea]
MSNNIIKFEEKIVEDNKELIYIKNGDEDEVMILSTPPPQTNNESFKRIHRRHNESFKRIRNTQNNNSNNNKTTANHNATTNNRWSNEDDHKLLNIIQSHIRWSEVAREFGGIRNANSCKRRWRNYTSSILRRDALRN